MPISLKNVNYSPLHNEMELVITDEKKMAEMVAFLTLGNHLHIKLILSGKRHVTPRPSDAMIDTAQNYLVASTKDKRQKRDGWLFQLITWVAISYEHQGENFHLQIPHDAPGQHGLDGVAVLLKKGNSVKQVIVTEDKCTIQPRGTLTSKVWPEFERFEAGKEDRKLVSRISGILTHLPPNKVLGSIQKDILRTEIRKYRASITPIDDDNKTVKRLDLFKGYDVCVAGNDHVRRNALTFFQPDIRKWMDSFAVLVHDALEDLKN